MIKRLTYAALAALIVLALAVGGMPARAYTTYWSKVLNTQSANLIAYWPFNELSGTTANDQSGNGRNVTYTGPTLNNSTGADGGSVPLFDGVNDYVSGAGTALSSSFSGTAGTIALWAKVYDASAWSAYQWLFYFQADGSNYVRLQRSTTGWAGRFTAGGTIKDYSASTTAGLGWYHLAVTWDKAAGATGEVRLYINGSLVAGPITGIGTWAGSLATSNIGTHASPAAYWSGWIGNFAVWTKALTAAEVAYIADTSIPPTATPTLTLTPTLPTSYKGALSSGYGYEVPLTATAGEIMIVIIGLIIAGLGIFSLFLSLSSRRG